MPSWKAFTIYAVTLSASTVAIVHTNGVWWAFAVAWATAAGGILSLHVANKAAAIRSTEARHSEAIRAYWQGWHHDQ